MLSDEQIKSLLIKDVSAKTVLVDKEEAEPMISSYLSEGWELVSKAELNGRIKITFKRIKAAK